MRLRSTKTATKSYRITATLSSARSNSMLSSNPYLNWWEMTFKTTNRSLKCPKSGPHTTVLSHPYSNTRRKCLLNSHKSRAKSLIWKEPWCRQVPPLMASIRGLKSLRKPTMNSISRTSRASESKKMLRASLETSRGRTKMIRKSLRMRFRGTGWDWTKLRPKKSWLKRSWLRLRESWRSKWT